MCCTASPRSYPRWCTLTRPSRSRTRSRSCANTGCRRFRLCGRNLRSWQPKSLESVVERDLLDVLFSGKAKLFDTVEAHMSAALPIVGAGESVQSAISALQSSDGVVVIEDGRPVGVPHPPRPARAPLRLEGRPRRGPNPCVRTGAMFYGVIMSVSGAQVDVILQQDLNAAGVLRVTLDDSARRNALSTRMLGELKEVLDRVASDAQVRVLVLAATGPAFSAGHDLKEITLAREHDDAGRSFFKDLMDQCATVMQAIINNPKPVIAEVSGVATAAGCQLVASCDLAYAAPTARFATPGVHIGLFCSTPMVALSA